MDAVKWFYEVLYGCFRAPWDIGPRKELVELVETGRLTPCTAIDLGSGTASNCIFLAQRGFDVTGVDFARPGSSRLSLASPSPICLLSPIYPQFWRMCKSAIGRMLRLTR